MSQKPKDPFGDLIVEASLDDIEKGARQIIGSRMRVIDKEDGVVVFSDDSETCPLEVIATQLKPGIYRLDVRSRCTIEGCDYFAECTRLDARAAKTLQMIMAEILGTPDRVHEGRVWMPERLKSDEKLRRLVDRIIDEGS
ncbi:MAG: hypothetical protein ACFFCO_13465 [Promethearchaeota archaeon]